MTVLANKTISGDCSQFCTADFNRKCTIELRAIADQKFGTTTPNMGFTVAFTGYFIIQTIRGTRRFSGVNIDENATHFFLARFRPSINNLDGAGQHFIRHGTKLYRVLEITNINEANNYILFQGTERGIDSHQETNA